MKNLSAEEFADKYVQRTGQASEAYKRGIQNTTVNPMERAAAREDYYLQRVTEASTSGRRREKLLSVPLSRWKDNAITIGASRLATGAQKARPKMVQHWQKWGPVYKSVSDTVQNMPKGGVAEAQARANKSIEMLMQAAGRL